MDVRAAFLDFFRQKGHRVYDSMPLVPNDASLLFTNAGMVQFKDIFTGKIPHPEIPRATSSQICMRAGGKHNDLENVGYTARHHTLFEMLGNFSFGDYFKQEAIAYAWELVTKVLGFDEKVLYVSVHESDDEAFRIWSEYIDPSKIARMGDKDNFWQMGDVGPCGPCSEIYVDQGSKFFHSSEDYFGGEGDRFLEIWNLVFMQYERDESGSLKSLPSPSIDTGMGLERVVALKEGKINNFDTSLFAPLMRCIENLTQEAYISDDALLKGSYTQEERDRIKARISSFRVIADHARSVAFLLAQGVHFDKEGRGYVLRRILRRAVRHGYLLGLKEAFLYKVIESLAHSMRIAYPYLLERKDTIIKQCKSEEERFLETIDAGMELFSRELYAMGFTPQSTRDSQDSHKIHKHSPKARFSGEVAFRLYDTYGFPLDLTQDMLRDRGIEVDMQGFESHMDAQKQRSKASWKGSGDSAQAGDFKELVSEFGENAFVGYESDSAHTKILALLDSTFRRVEVLGTDSEGYVLLHTTPMYPESGGPVGDKGILLDSQGQVCAQVSDTKKYFGLNISQVRVCTSISQNQEVLAQVDNSRSEIAKHHSATHLLHLSLRKILGEHIAQAGSLVEAHRLRFDFSHTKPLTQEELERIESDVNAQICAANTQICEVMPLEEAKSKGAMALFGEKYTQNVRVVRFGDSIELCGGIHVANTAQIGSFYITKESGVSSGVRRIEAVCGYAAYEWGKRALETLREAKDSLKAQDVLLGIAKIQSQLKEIKQKAANTKAHTKGLEFEQVGEHRLIISVLENIDNAQAKQAIDEAKNMYERVALLLFVHNGDKISIVAGVKNAPLKAGAWVKEVAQILGGNGGGRDDFATAGGKDVAHIDKALRRAREFALEHLK